MGYYKDQMIEMQNQQGDRRLADLLGISYDELLELDYKIEPDQNNDGHIYNFRVVFNKDNSSKEILDKIYLIEDDGITVNLDPWDFNDDYDYVEQYDAIIENKEYLQKFRDETSNLKLLNALNVPDAGLKAILKRQLYISVIGTMETFLSDTFINLTDEKEDFFRNFIETHPEFKKRKFELREIFEEQKKLKETAKIVMLEIIYHNLPTISQMYKDTFKIEFPPIKDIYECVLKRHDLVHRNGRTKEGAQVDSDENAVNELIDKVTNFIEEIAAKLDIT